MSRLIPILFALLVAMSLFLSGHGSAWAGGGRLELIVVDRTTGRPIPCRLHLSGKGSRPVKIKKTPFWHDHFAFPGRIMLNLPKGEYAFELERGPEYVTRSGHFTINDFADDAKQVDLKRFVDMASDGWYSGDLHVGRPPTDIELLMQAEDLHVVPVLTWSNKDHSRSTPSDSQGSLVRFDGNRYYQILAGKAVWPGGELLLFNLPRPSTLPDAKEEFPSPAEYLAETKQTPDAWIDLSKPFWWDLPMLVALGRVDSIQVAHSHLCRTEVIANEAHGKPRDKALYPGMWGNPRWSQDIYFRLLDCGLRIPPTAGSGTGESPNPVGYNRMYVHVESEFTYARWWENLRRGRVTVTNGPLVRPRVHGELPGHVFQAEAGRRLELEIGLTLSTRKPISYLEIIKNGRVEHSIRFDEYRTSGQLPKLTFDRGGWFLVRAVTDLPKTYRFAMTGPYYVEIGGRPRVSRTAAQFFLDWTYERARQVVKIEDPTCRRAVLEYHRRARDFWQERLSRANAE